MSENYHKAALGGGVVVLAAVGYLAWSKNSAQQEALIDSSSGRKGDDVAVEGGPEADALLDSFTTLNPLDAKVLSSGRKVDLFNSVNLFIQDGDISQTVDLEEIPDVHVPIPNIWWIKNRVDPSFSDSPQRDKDGDGFTNLEEFEAKTDPSDAKSYPLLVDKLEIDQIDSNWWLVLLNSSFGNDDLQFRYKDGDGQETRMRATDNIQAGQVFFPEGPAKGRFKAIEPGSRMVEGRNGRQVEEKYYLIEDLSENKKGTRYEAAFRPRAANEPLHYQFDNTVTFVLNAAGQEGKTHTVKENESFSINVDGKKLTYKLLKVDMGTRPNLDPLSVDVEYDDDDEKKVRTIKLK